MARRVKVEDHLITEVEDHLSTEVYHRDQIVASCDTMGDTPIVQLRGRIVSVFLAQHPQDRA